MSSKDKGQNYEESVKNGMFGYTQTEIVQILDECLSKPDEYDEFLKKMDELDEKFLPSIRDENGNLLPLSEEDLSLIAKLFSELDEEDKTNEQTLI